MQAVYSMTMLAVLHVIGTHTYISVLFQTPWVGRSGFLRFFHFDQQASIHDIDHATVCSPDVSKLPAVAFLDNAAIPDIGVEDMIRCPNASVALPRFERASEAADAV